MATVTQELQGAKDLVNAKGGELSPLAKMYDSKGTSSPQPVEPTVSAQQLANPVSTVQPPAPAMSTNDGSRTQGLIDNQAAQLEQIIGADLESRKQADELNRLLGEQQVDGQAVRAGMMTDFQVPELLKRRTDILSQLTKANTASNVQKTRIGAGNSIAQGNREITQQDRENALQTAGLAAEAAVLQGSIETASTLVNQAMSDYYNDRQLNNQNMIQQLNYFSKIADDETSQLLQKEQRAYEADQAKVEQVQNSVRSALQSGAATTKEVQMLTDPETSDGERLALAQLIEARGATEERNLSKRSAEMDLAVKAQQLAKLREPAVATRDTKVVEVGDQKQLIDTQTGDVIATFGADVSTDEISQARDVNYVNTVDALKSHPGLNSSVGPVGLARMAVGDQFGNKDDFIASTENILKKLTMQTYQEAKDAGATFGAMQQAEWDMLAEAASKISQTRVYEKEGFPGFRSDTDNVKGYDINEDVFKEELDLISNFGKMNAIRNGANPEEIGVVQEADGLYSTFNHDGSITQFKIGTNNEISVQ